MKYDEHRRGETRLCAGAMYLITTSGEIREEWMIQSELKTTHRDRKDCRNLHVKIISYIHGLWCNNTTQVRIDSVCEERVKNLVRNLHFVPRSIHSRSNILEMKTLPSTKDRPTTVTTPCRRQLKLENGRLRDNGEVKNNLKRNSRFKRSKITHKRRQECKILVSARFV